MNMFLPRFSTALTFSRLHVMLNRQYRQTRLERCALYAGQRPLQRFELVGSACSENVDMYRSICRGRGTGIRARSKGLGLSAMR